MQRLSSPVQLGISVAYSRERGVMATSRLVEIQLRKDTESYANLSRLASGLWAFQEISWLVYWQRLLVTQETVYQYILYAQ